MSIGHTISGLAGLGLAAHLAIQAVLPTSAFMAVRNLEYDAGAVKFNRVIYAPATVADYTVSVFAPGADQPICSGHGWAEYTPEEERAKTMPLDVFVNDDGCSERLLSGVQYRLYVFWVPRDQRQAVYASKVFAP